MNLDLKVAQGEFVERFGGEGRFFHAPGRVNLIGEHTDYNDGFVMPVAIERGTLVGILPRADRKLRLFSKNLERLVEVDLAGPTSAEQGGWTSYVEGMARVLSSIGIPVGGADLFIWSDVPTGAGLSSSAALEMSVGLAFLAAAGTTLDKKALALAGQSAEHTYVGTKCGIMDQYISAMGEAGKALLIDCRSLEATPVAMGGGDAVILICDSGVKHALASSEYNTRRRECESAVRSLRSALPGVRALRDVSEADLLAHQGLLAPTLLKRARHVVSENARTLRAAEALKAGALAEVGSLMAASHASLRDDYQVSCKELDVLVDAALAAPGIYGARMTGGGFGGCTVNLVQRGQVEAAREAISRAYEKLVGRRPQSFATAAVDGARAL